MAAADVLPRTLASDIRKVIVDEHKRLNTARPLGMSGWNRSEVVRYATERWEAYREAFAKHENRQRELRAHDQTARDCAMDACLGRTVWVSEHGPETFCVEHTRYDACMALCDGYHTTVVAVSPAAPAPFEGNNGVCGPVRCADGKRYEYRRGIGFFEVNRASGLLVTRPAPATSLTGTAAVRMRRIGAPRNTWGVSSSRDDAINGGM